VARQKLPPSPCRKSSSSSREAAAARVWQARPATFVFPTGQSCQLAQAASAGFRRPCEALCGRARHPATGQNVGAVLDASSGWGVDARPARVADLERELSKHLDFCVVHLRRPMGNDGKAKQLAQNRVLLRQPKPTATPRLRPAQTVETARIIRPLGIAEIGRAAGEGVGSQRRPRGIGQIRANFSARYLRRVPFRFKKDALVKKRSSDDVFPI